jgi:hypothetical protein
MLGSALLVAAVVVITVSFELFDPDLWTHLVLGKAILQLHQVPDRHAWIWPTYAEPEISPSWLFQVLVWPLWSMAGVLGLFALRWLSALAVSGLTWASARRMGARGFAALGVLLLCVVQLGIRSQIRPEGLVTVLIALEIYLLESARLGGRDRTLWIVAVLWAWANLHVSSPLGFLILGAYGIDEAVRSRRADHTDHPDRGRLRRLIAIGLAGLAVSLANPFGWRTLWLPFDYFLHLRHEPLTADVLELRPFPLHQLVGRGLILPLVAWALLTLIRPGRRRPDVAEILLCLSFTALAFQSRRFIGFYLVTAAPFLMRDVDAWLTAIGERGGRGRGWRAPIWARAALLAVLCVAVAYRRWTQPDPRIGVSINYENVPVGACDFMAAENVRGRAFNPFESGGYLLYRFWPDRTRLPFIDTQMSGGPRNRFLYWQALTNPTVGWTRLDAQFRFDYVLMGRLLAPDHPLLDVLDADTSLALVFADDAAALFVRRREARWPRSPRALRTPRRRPGAGSWCRPSSAVVSTHRSAPGSRASWSDARPHRPGTR